MAMRTELSSIQLEVYKHLFASIAEEMGVVLRKASYSPNIKERRDFSCALFDPQRRMIAQADHIPVHLGSMPLSVQSAVGAFTELGPGDAVLLNDPFRGGTHLPDITLVTPVFLEGEGLPENLLGYTATRAHHADVGGMAAGSMPVARELYQEGLVIPPVKLFEKGKLNQAVLDLVLANVRTPEERLGDLWAQIASNQRGAERLREAALKHGPETLRDAMEALLAYTERMARRLLEGIPDGTYRFEDALDNDGIGSEPVPIRVAVTIRGDRAEVDFSGSAPQCEGSTNAVYAITQSAVYYVIRCLIGLGEEVGEANYNNSGCMAPVEVIAPEGTVVNARFPAAVSAGNVETSQRIVDVLLGALAQAVPEKVPAASQGTMNNLTIGGVDRTKGKPFAYYETTGGGMGARPDGDGPSALHSHMTNTLNTPVEALEFAYPLRVRRFEIRRGSGGAGKYRGGDGIRRDIELLEDAQVTLVSERRILQPYGLAGGEPGGRGENVLIREGRVENLPGKGSFYLRKGDILSVRTPGGGGFGEPTAGV